MVSYLKSYLYFFRLHLPGDGIDSVLIFHHYTTIKSYSDKLKEIPNTNNKQITLRNKAIGTGIETQNLEAEKRLQPICYEGIITKVSVQGWRLTKALCKLTGDSV